MRKAAKVLHAVSVSSTFVTLSGVLGMALAVLLRLLLLVDNLQTGLLFGWAVSVVLLVAALFTGHLKIDSPYRKYFDQKG